MTYIEDKELHVFLYLGQCISSSHFRQPRDYICDKGDKSDMKGIMFCSTPKNLRKSCFLCNLLTFAVLELDGHVMYLKRINKNKFHKDSQDSGVVNLLV